MLTAVLSSIKNILIRQLILFYIICMHYSSQCNRQDAHRVAHGKWGDYPKEGWRGPCGVNEVTCHISGYGDEGLLTYDWKHFPYEDYDTWLFGETGQWKLDNSERRPDILVVQVGMHVCTHAHNQNASNAEDYSMIDNDFIRNHTAKIRSLMQSIRQAIDRPVVNRTNTVIVVTSGAAYFPGDSSSIDRCIYRINRVTSHEAHKQGFAVLERGEIERRIMYKSLYAEDPLLTPDAHLAQPVQNIVATCLLRMMTCLNTTGFDIFSPEVKEIGELKARGRSEAGPMHMPPPA